VSLWQSIKERLGMGDDEYYDEYYDEDEPPADSSAAQDDADEPAAAYRSPYQGAGSAVRRLNREPDLARAREAARTSVNPGPGIQAVPQVRMQIVEPRTYSEAQSIADKFKVGVPVIMNLTMTDPDLAKRLIDFASGLTYGLNGGLQKVAEKVFMLTPANVDVSEQRRVLREKGLFDLNV